MAINNIIDIQLRWSDFDANYHLRHSVYYDYAAMGRIALFNDCGLSSEIFRAKQFGPILFKETCQFKKEVHMQDALKMTTMLLECRQDGSRFSFVHSIYKQDNVLAAEITIWGDWIDYTTRKLWKAEPFLIAMLDKIPKHKDFTFLQVPS